MCKVYRHYIFLVVGGVVGVGGVIKMKDVHQFLEPVLIHLAAFSSSLPSFFFQNLAQVFF